jgi:flagellar biosynthesis/type III secretory pathway chaperone
MNTAKTFDPEELFQNLQTSQKLAEELLDLLSQENAALQKMDIRSLAGLTKLKETLLVKIHYLDNRIAETVRQSVPGKKEKKLAELAPMLAAAQASVLVQFNKNLTKLRQDIQAKNLINKRFTGDTMRFINDAISVITAQPKNNRLYGSKGMARYSDKTPTMISREV